MTKTFQPQRGDIWFVDFNPIVGAEIAKIRPAVVLSPFMLGILPLRIVVPLTHWDNKYLKLSWFVQIKQTVKNGLQKDSGANCFQVKSVSVERFQRKIGIMAAQELNEVTHAVAACIGA